MGTRASLEARVALLEGRDQRRRRRNHRVLVGVAALSIVAGGVARIVTTAGPVAATVRTFTNVGTIYGIGIPTGVEFIQVDVYGAQGGTGSGTGAGTGAFGARVRAQLRVTPLETIFFELGGAGENASGITGGRGGVFGGGRGGNSGNIGGNTSGAGGGGGGNSGIRRGTEYLVMAAGGGGGGGSGAGGQNGGAGNPGGWSGGDLQNIGDGRGGTPFAGGAGGSCTNGVSGSSGESQRGGGGASTGAVPGGGGGGGGLWGGGGGAASCPVSGNPPRSGGGGGGSSLGPPGAIYETGVDAANSGHGKIVLTYPVTAPSGAALTPLSPIRLVATPPDPQPVPAPLNAYANRTIAGGGTLTVTLAGRLDAPVNQASPVPLSASAIVFTLSAVGPAATFLTVFPADVASPPGTATLSVPMANAFASSEVTAKLGANGAGKAGVRIFNRGSSPVDVYVDVSGYYA